MAARRIRRFEFPLAGSSGSTASLTVYRQGATSKGSATLPPSSATVDSLPVDSVGALQVGDSITVYRAGTAQPGALTVLGVPSPTDVDLANNSTQTVSVLSGDRLVPTNAKPLTYGSPSGLPAHQLANPLSVPSNLGQIQFYAREFQIDLYAVVPGQVTTLYANYPGLAIHEPAWISVLDYPTLQAAVDAVPVGGAVVYIPAGTYSPNGVPTFIPPLSLPHDRSVHLLGDGPGRTVLRYRFNDVPGSYDPSKDFIQNRGDNQTVEGLSLVGDFFFAPEGTSPTGVGIRVWRSADPLPQVTKVVYRTSIRNVTISGMPSWGIYVDDALRNNERQISVWAMYDNVTIREGVLNGCVYIGQGDTTTQYFKNCNFKDTPGGPAVHAKEARGLSFIDCIFENVASRANPYVILDGCESVVLQHCWFEGWSGPGFPFIRLTGTNRGIGIDACHFQNGGQPVQDPEAVHVSGLARGVVISGISLCAPADMSLAQTPHIRIDAGVPVPPPALPEESEVIVVGGVARGGNSRYPLRVSDGSQKVTLLGPGRRLRLPRLTVAERDAILDWQPGDLIYNVAANRAQAWDGNAWKDLW